MDVNGKVVLTQIPDSVLGQLEYMGTHNFTTLPTATQKGQYWIASVSGNGYIVGDWAVWNGSAFDKVDNTDAVATVAGRTGNVVLTKSDVGLANVDNTSDANKPVSTAQQTALNLKANLASPVFTGNVTGLGIATGTSFNSITGLSSVVGTTNGTAAIGTSTTAARADHVHPVQTTITGNAATATALQTSRNIGGVAFNGTSDITLPGVNATGNQATTGNAATATKLATARNIALAGDITGSADFDGTTNISITATIAANSVVLGTDTTGNYVAGNTAGTGISITGTAGEGWSPTIALTNVGAAGTYRSVTTDAQGRVTAGTNPTTLAGYGITDAVAKVTSTDNAIVRFDGTTSNVKNSTAILTDGGGLNLTTPELVTNGDFGTNTAGWTSYMAVVSRNASGQLVVDDSAASGGYSSARQLLNIKNGVKYIFTGTIVSIVGTAAFIRMLRSPTSEDADSPIIINDTTQTGTFTVQFIGDETFKYLALGAGGSSIVTFDNVSVKEAPIQLNGYSPVLQKNPIIVVDDNDKVGINKTLASSKFNINHVPTGTTPANMNLTMTLQNDSTVAGTINSLGFVNSGGFATSAIYTSNNGATNAGSNIVLNTKNSSGTWNNGLVLDTIGNLGLGATPSNWHSTLKSISFNNSALAGDTNTTNLTHNGYYDGAWKYKETGPTVGQLIVGGNTLKFRTSSAGTAGAALTFTDRLNIDAAGNLGIGVTPSAWASGAKSIQLGGASIHGDANANGIQTTANGYLAADGWRYISTAAASNTLMHDDGIKWRIAPSGTAGTPIIWNTAMTLGSNGNLLVGTTIDNGVNKLQVNGSISATSFVGGLAGNASTATNVAWSGVTGKPTTLSGYGITDAVTKVTSTDNAIVRFNGTTGEVQNSAITIDDSGNIGSGMQSFNGFGGSGFKNYIINGNFDIWQRGTSGVSNGAVVGPDMWRVWANAANTNWSQATSADFGTYGSNIRFGLKWYGDPASNQDPIEHRIESKNAINLSNKYVTISFVAKSSVTQTVAIELIKPNAEDNYTATTAISNSSISVTTTATKFSVTLLVDDVKNGLSCVVRPSVKNQSMHIAQVQLEEGSIATPFENRPYGLELSLCQRYYQKIAWSDRKTATASGQYLHQSIRLPVDMRVTPTTITNISAGSVSNALFNGNAALSNIHFIAEAVSLAAGDSYILNRVDSLSAEL